MTPQELKAEWEYSLNERRGCLWPWVDQPIPPAIESLARDEALEHIERLKAQESKCQKCGNKAQPMHPCPYRSDIDGDNETMCNCCEECQHECAMDV